MKLFSRYYVIACFIGGFLSCCMMFHTTVTTKYIVFINGTETLSGVVLTLFTAAATVTRLFAGRLVDKKSRLGVARIGMVIYAASSAAMCVPSLMLIPVFRIVQGIGFGLSATGVVAAVTDILPATRVGEGIGYYGVLGSIAMALGPATAMALYYRSGSYEFVYLLSAALVVVALVLSLFCRYEKDEAFLEKKRAEDLKSGVKEVEALLESARPISLRDVLEKYIEPTALPSSCVAVITGIPTAFLAAFLVVYAESIGIANATIYFTLSAVFTILSRTLFGKLADKYRPLVSIIPGIICLIVGYVSLLIAASNNAFYYIASFFIGIGGGMLTPTLNALAVRYVPAKRRGVAVATFSLSGEVGIGIGGLLFGVLVQGFGYGTAIRSCIGCFCVGLLLSLVFFVRTKSPVEILAERNAEEGIYIEQVP